MIDSKSRELLLQQYAVLRELPSSRFDELCANASLIQAPRGTVMFDEDQHSQGIPFLLSGSVRVFRAAPNGRELFLYQITPGDTCILTTSCILANATYRARGIVEEDARVTVIPPAAFLSLIAELGTFRDSVLKDYSDRLSDLIDLISAVAFQRLDQRLALSLVAKSPSFKTTHQALADELGSVREIISRLLKNFANNGWISLGREQISILDAQALKKFSSL